MNSKHRMLAVAAQMALFFVFAWVILAWPYANYLREIEAQTLFVPTRVIWDWHMLLPGGLLSWAGCWLTQFFFHPVLGGALLALLLAAVGWLSARAMRVPASLFGVALAIPAMLLLMVLQIGYALFSLKSPGFAFSNALGMAVAMGWCWACRCMPWQALRAVMAVVAPLAYPWLGFYALLASALCAAVELVGMAKQGKMPLIFAVAIAVLAAASIVVTPRFYFAHGWQLAAMDGLYLAGLPVYYPNETMMWAPFWVIGAAIVLCCLSPLMPWANNDNAKPALAVAPGAAALVLALAAVVAFRVNDPNFFLTLDLKQAVANEDWEGAIKARQRYGDDLEPTRVNVLYTAIALWRQDQAGDRLFTFPAGSHEYESTRKGTVMRDIIAQDICLHMGRVNTAYRWCMEYCVEYGLKVAYLKDMVMCAMINGELKLAQKYVDTLKQTMWHKPWAERYQAYIDNPELLHDNATLTSIKPLTFYRDHIGGDGGKLESYLMPLTAGLSGGTTELQRLTLDCNLVQKDIDEFMKKLQPLYASMGPGAKLPRHYQEAVLLWSLIHENSAYTYFNIDEALIDQFTRFNAMARTSKAQNLSESERAEIFRGPFGKTYWYYFFFNLNMKTK